MCTLYYDEEKIQKLLKLYNGRYSTTYSRREYFEGTTEYMIFGGKLFIKRSGKDLQTNEAIDELKEADEDELFLYYCQTVAQIPDHTRHQFLSH